MEAPQILRWRVAWSAALLMTAFWTVHYLVPFKPLMQSLNALVLCVSISVVLTYAPAWAQTLAKPRLDGGDALSLGIGCTWCSDIGFRLWSIAWRGLDNPEWMLTTAILPLLLTVNFMGGVLHLTAPGAVDGVVPRRNWIILGITVGAAFFVILITIMVGRGAFGV